MSIRARLIYSFVGVAALVAVVGGAGLTLAARLSGLQANELPLERDLREIEVGTWAAVQAANAFRLTGDPAENARFQRETQGIEKHVTAFLALGGREQAEPIAEFELAWNRARRLGEELIGTTMATRRYELAFFEHVAAADDVIDSQIQAQFLPTDPELLAKEQALREVEVSIWEAIHAAEQHEGLMEASLQPTADSATFADLMEKEFVDVSEFWPVYVGLATSAEERQAIEAFDEEWRLAIEAGRALIVSHDRSVRLGQEMNMAFAQAGQVIATRLRSPIEQRMGRHAVTARRLHQLVIGVTLFTFATALGLGVLIAGWMTRRLNALATAVNDFAEGCYEAEADSSAGDELADLAGSVNRMFAKLRTSGEAARQEDWLKTGLAKLAEEVRGDQDLYPLGRKVLSVLCEYLDAQIAAFYVADADGVLTLLASHAYANRKNLSNRFRPGEGLVGQAALERESIRLTEVPEDYIRVVSGLGETAPRNILVAPLVHLDEVNGVIEIGSIRELTQLEVRFVNEALSTIAVGVSNAQARDRLNGLLDASQRQGEELQAQQEELRQTNEELEARTDALQRSEALLLEQQEATERINRDLQNRTVDLETRGNALGAAREKVEAKARQLEQASRYKSEFLANMSHELRTPLNSMLVLSQVMAANESGNLTERQVESIETIHGAGNDLLRLINDILDLSKVEAGEMEVYVEQVQLEDVAASMERQFAHVAANRELEFGIEFGTGLPANILTDRQRLEQILKNLLSNALKFTETGAVTLRIERPGAPIDLPEGRLAPESAIAFAVHDTGAGIPDEKRDTIFDAFRQVDGTISRRFGGTGLGLSISSRLADLLGGAIQIESEESKGSTFTLCIPESLPSPPRETLQDAGDLESEEMTGAGARLGTHSPQPSNAESPGNDSVDLRVAEDSLPVGDEAPADAQIDPCVDEDDAVLEAKRVLIVDDDMRNTFALISALSGVGIEALGAKTGREAIERLEEQPDIDAVLMDIMMPEMDGYEAIGLIREQPRFQKLPIIALTAKAMKGDRQKCIDAGANDYLTKPVDVEALLSLIRIWVSR